MPFGTRRCIPHVHIRILQHSCDAKRKESFQENTSILTIPVRLYILCSQQLVLLSVAFTILLDYPLFVVARALRLSFIGIFLISSFVIRPVHRSESLCLTFSLSYSHILFTSLATDLGFDIG